MRIGTIAVAIAWSGAAEVGTTLGRRLACLCDSLRMEAVDRTGRVFAAIMGEVGVEDAHASLIREICIDPVGVSTALAVTSLLVNLAWFGALSPSLQRFVLIRVCDLVSKGGKEGDFAPLLKAWKAVVATTDPFQRMHALKRAGYFRQP